MWSMALKILSILGIILLCLLILVLTALLLVLFCPVTYRGGSTAHAGEYRVWFRFRWFLGLVRGTFSYPGEGGTQIKLLWRTVYGGGKRAEEDSKDPAPGASESSEKTAETMSETGESSEKTVETMPETGESSEKAAEIMPETGESSEKATETVSEQQTGKVSEPSSQAATADGGQKAEEAEAENKNQQAKAEGRRGLKERLPAFLELIRDRDNQELVKHGFSRLGKILRSLRPRFLRAQALVGLGEPDLTGYAYGIYWAVKPFLGKKCQAAITPDFERRVIEGEIVLGGRVMAAVVLHHVVRVLLDRRLRRLIDRLKTI